MKKKPLLMSLGFIAILLFVLVKFNNKEKTLYDALAINNLNSMTILHDEKTNEGSIVFCIDEKEDYMYTSIIKKGIFGYENLYSGTQGSIKKASEILGLTNQYFPAIKKTSLPIYFGIIGDPNVKVIKIIEENDSNKYKEAKIIEAKDKRIWLVYMDGFNGDSFNIIALSDDDKELFRISDKLPWPVERKAVKSPYL